MKKVMLLIAVCMMALMSIGVAFATTPTENQYCDDPTYASENPQECGPGNENPTVGICHSGNGKNYAYVPPENTPGHAGHKYDYPAYNGPEDCEDKEPTDPEVTDPEVTDPEVTDPEVTDPTGSATPEPTDPGPGVQEEVKVSLNHICTIKLNGDEKFRVTNNGEETVSGRLVTGFERVSFTLLPGDSVVLRAQVSQGNGEAYVVVDGNRVATVYAQFDLCREPSSNPNEPNGPGEGPTVPNDTDNPGVVVIKPQPDVNTSQITVNTTVYNSVNTSVVQSFNSGVGADDAVAKAKATAVSAGASEVQAKAVANHVADKVYDEEGASVPGITELPETGGPALALISLLAGLGLLGWKLSRLTT